jgi:hypothetical protein
MWYTHDGRVINNPQVNVCKTQRKKTSRIVPVCYDLGRRSFGRGFPSQKCRMHLRDHSTLFISALGRVWYTSPQAAMQPHHLLSFVGRAGTYVNVPARVQCFGGTAPRKGPERAMKIHRVSEGAFFQLRQTYGFSQRSAGKAGFVNKLNLAALFP